MHFCRLDWAPSALQLILLAPLMGMVFLLSRFFHFKASPSLFPTPPTHNRGTAHKRAKLLNYALTNWADDDASADYCFDHDDFAPSLLSPSVPIISSQAVPPPPQCLGGSQDSSKQTPVAWGELNPYFLGPACPRFISRCPRTMAMAGPWLGVPGPWTDALSHC